MADSIAKLNELISKANNLVGHEKAKYVAALEEAEKYARKQGHILVANSLKSKVTKIKNMKNYRQSRY